MTLGPATEQDIHSARFRREREEAWLRLESLLRRLGSRRDPLTAEELAELPKLYRTALSSLSVARNYVLDRRLTHYLEALCLRAYFAIYAPRDSLWGLMSNALTTDFPRAVRAALPEILIAALLLAVGIAAGYAIVAGNPGLYYGIVPESLAQGRSPDATYADMLATIRDDAIDGERLMAFALFLAQHNSAVALLAFGLGLAFGLPTMLLLLYTGAILGAMVAAFSVHDLTLPFVAWLGIHGVTELGAIVIAAAGGLVIARGMLFPAPSETRLASVRRRGLLAGYLMMGAVAMLFIAALLEGFARQMIQPTEMRLVIGAATGTVWILYFAYAGHAGGPARR